MVDETETLGGALEDIRAFCAVVELGSISGAARHRGETKGAVSRRISRLEQRLGTLLLSRTPRAVTATEEGLTFYAKARDALELLDDAAESARQSQAIPRGRLRVTAPHDLGLELLPPLIARFRAEHPQIAIDLVLSSRTLDLAANRIDLALRATMGELPDMGYRASTLGEFVIKLYAAPDYLEARANITTPDDLAAHEVISTRDNSRDYVRWQLVNARGKPAEVVLRPAMYSSEFSGTHRLVLVGAGVGALPDLVARAEVEAGLLIPVLPDWTLARVRLHAISVAGRDAPARVRAFREFLRRHLA